MTENEVYKALLNTHSNIPEALLINSDFIVSNFKGI